MFGKVQVSALALAASLIAAPAIAQETGDAPAPVPTEVTVPVAVDAAERKQVYTPQDFARFAPRTAFDMLNEVPGFTIRGAENERGLGQASENVLVNGQRIANKSGGAIDELQRTPAANVARIEIVDAATLGIAGLVGQVANVVLAENSAASVQFEWRPDIRAHYAEPNLFDGSISFSDKKGPVSYTLSVNNNAGRGAFGGPIVITDANGTVIERREQEYHSESDLVTFQSKFGFDGPGTSEANLTLAYTPYWAPLHDEEVRVRVGGDTLYRVTDNTLDGYYIDVSGDVAFALGPGRLKLIGVRHFDHEPVDTVQRTRYASGAPDQGVRFLRDSRIAETVFRGEYGWSGGGNDWQLSLERAYNSLDQRGQLFLLGANGEFAEVPYPEGSGHVVETRYEGIATWSRALGSTLNIQVAAGAEQSQLGRLDSDIPARSFFRPKGSVTFGWRPSPAWDLSLKLRRRVGQISFYDFLAQPNLRDERENSGNPDLVPPQSWEADLEIGKNLGAWGQTRLRLYGHLIEDIIDIIPIGEDGEAIGNLPSAKRFGAEWTSTFQLDPAGIRGAKVDLTVGLEHTSVEDPLSGEQREISGNRNRYVNMSYRHDIPGSDLAYGVSASHNNNAFSYFLTEVGRGSEGPVFVSAYVEHKDVFGLTVRAQVGNIFNARHRFERTVYDGRRLRDPVDYIQENDQLIGPIFSALVKGSF